MRCFGYWLNFMFLSSHLAHFSHDITKRRLKFKFKLKDVSKHSGFASANAINKACVAV